MGKWAILVGVDEITTFSDLVQTTSQDPCQAAAKGCCSTEEADTN